MDVIQKNEQISFIFDKNSNIKRLSNLFQTKDVVRFAISDFDKEKGLITADYAALSEMSHRHQDVFKINHRKYENQEHFNVVMVVPTGIGADVGGDSGDACAVAKLIGNVVDTLITHPNVVNAADINEMTNNTLYVEGSVLNRFMMGTIGLSKVRSNKILLIYDENNSNGEAIEEHIKNCSINSASALRMTVGTDIDVVGIKHPPYYKLFYDEKGMATGQINNIERLVDLIDEYKDKYDCFALHTIIEADNQNDVLEKYFNSNELTINPWGSVEAIITHTISNQLDVVAAHAPMITDNFKYSVVNPEKSAETLSKTELFCLLKGLSTAPKIITDENLIHRNGVLTSEDISAIIIPDRCIGLPVLAALEQNIPVIVVDDLTNIMKNDLDKLPWTEGKFFRVKNYLEAVGVLQCLKSGIAPKNVVRPIEHTKILE